MLAELWSMDTPIVSIANVLGRTQETIRWKARSLGLKGGGASAEGQIMKLPDLSQAGCGIIAVGVLGFVSAFVFLAITEELSIRSFLYIVLGLLIAVGVGVGLMALAFFRDEWDAS